MRAVLTLLTLLTATPAFAGADDPWTIDAGKSRIEFNASQIGKLITGRVRTWSGTIVLNPANLAAARLDIRMDMKSATAGSKDIDDLMLGKDFLDAGNAPEARFVSDAVTSRGGERYEARGKLTIRGATRDIVLPFTLRIGEAGAIATASARGKLDIRRLDYGIGRNEWAGTNHVADEVTIEIAVTASRAR